MHKVTGHELFFLNHWCGRIRHENGDGTIPVLKGRCCYEAIPTLEHEFKPVQPESLGFPNERFVFDLMQRHLLSIIIKINNPFYFTACKSILGMSGCLE